MSARQRAYLHIGAPKTGTTYLQEILRRNRPALARAGVLYPGTQEAHYRASRDLRERTVRGHVDTHVPGTWDRLVREARGWPDRSLISHETFSASPRRIVERALTDLDFAEVHVVFTARDLARQLPATWQERLKNGSTATYAEFLRSVRAAKDERDSVGRAFWAAQGVPSILARWSRSLPPEHVHIVTLPPTGSEPGLLWRRFAGVLELDPDAFDSSASGSNTSLGAPEAAVLRQLNEAIADFDVAWPAYASLFKQRLAPVLSERRSAPIGLPEESFEWAVEQAQRITAELQAAGYSVAGDLAELVPTSRPVGLDPDDVPADARADASLAGMVSMVALVGDSRVATTAVRRSQRGAVARRVEDFVSRTPALARLRDAYRARRG